MSAKSYVRRMFEMSWRDRTLLVEATFSLAAASLAIQLLPFRRVVSLAGDKPEPVGRGTSSIEEEVERVRWAVEACARLLPWKIVCFQKGLALHKMLRSRGIASILHYGVGQNASEGLKAHVWVTYDGRSIIGGEEAKDYACLATYPPLARPHG